MRMARALSINDEFCSDDYYPYFSGLFHQHWGNRTIAPMPLKTTPNNKAK